MRRMGRMRPMRHFARSRMAPWSGQGRAKLLLSRSCHPGGSAHGPRPPDLFSLDIPPPTAIVDPTTGGYQVARDQSSNDEIAGVHRAPATKPRPHRGQARNAYGVPELGKNRNAAVERSSLSSQERNHQRRDAAIAEPRWRPYDGGVEYGDPRPSETEAGAWA